MPLARTGKRLVVDNRAVYRRIRSLKRPGESDYAFARRTGVSLNQFRRSATSKDHAGLGLGSLVRISRATGKRLDWLVLGK